MARFEKLQDLFGLLCRTREPQPLAALCDQLGASPATVKRLIAFLREQRGIDIRFDREHGGYRLERGPADLRTAELLGLSGRELSALLEAEAILEQIPPGFVRDETEPARARLGKVRQRALGLRQNAGPRAPFLQMLRGGDGVLQHRLLVRPVGIGRGRASPDLVLAIGLEQCHVDAVERGAGHQPQGLQRF